MKRKFSGLKLKEVMQMIPAERFAEWKPDAPPRPVSERLEEALKRLHSFDLQTTEAAKILLIDALFAEIVPDHANLKVWKAAALETDMLTGIADYLLAPHRAYIATPLLCVVEAKRDDFEMGAIQYLAGMLACRWNNTKEGHDMPVFGIVSNGRIWQFYKLTTTSEVFETTLYTMSSLPELLGILDYVCAECARLLPESSL